MKKLLFACLLIPALAYSFSYTNNPQTGKPDLVTTSVADITDISTGYVSASTFSGYTSTRRLTVTVFKAYTTIKRVPYTGATTDVDLGTHNISAAAVKVTGTAGAGYITLAGQSSNPTSPAAGTILIHSSTANGFTRAEQDNEAATNVIYGRDSVYIAKNTSGSTINAGQAVYKTGSTGNVPNIGLAKADSTTTLPAIGIALDSIDNNAFGQVMGWGVKSSFNTSALGTDSVWVSPTTAGALTSTRPTYPNYTQRIGSVLINGIGNGSLLVTTAPHIGGMDTGTNAATFTATSFVGALTGNASTATTLQTARTINSVSFNGSANIQTATANTSDYLTNTWTPTFTNLTLGAPSTVNITGTYTTIGNLVYWKVYVQPTGGTTTSAAGSASTYHDLPPSQTPNGQYSSTVANAGTGLGIGVGQVGTTYHFVPAWSATTSPITLQGWYQK